MLTTTNIISFSKLGNGVSKNIASPIKLNPCIFAKNDKFRINFQKNDTQTSFAEDIFEKSRQTSSKIVRQNILARDAMEAGGHAVKKATT